MSARYVATFFSHFGATCFRRLCRDRGVPCELSPVPRSLSSSCGTCAFFDVLPLGEGERWGDEVELVAEAGEGAAPWRELYRAEGA